LVAVAVLLAIFIADRDRDRGRAGGFAYAVGSPGPGEAAPPIALTATDGSTFELSGARGRTVLLYFQEGVGCQPCWTQIRDIERRFADFEQLGIDEVVTITGDALDLLQRKAADEGLTTKVLADPGLGVSVTYEANQYGMMGTSTDGHSFILVDDRGQIRWRADYGGPPDFTMYVPVDSLLADLSAGLGESGQ
jgi:peroxiredoxin Q/BCP